jgi:hypothetical protein
MGQNPKTQKTPANAGVCDALPIGAASAKVEAGGIEPLWPPHYRFKNAAFRTFWYGL